MAYDAEAPDIPQSAWQQTQLSDGNWTFAPSDLPNGQQQMGSAADSPFAQYLDANGQMTNAQMLQLQEQLGKQNSSSSDLFSYAPMLLMAAVGGLALSGAGVAGVEAVPLTAAEHGALEALVGEHAAEAVATAAATGTVATTGLDAATIADAAAQASAFETAGTGITSGVEMDPHAIVDGFSNTSFSPDTIGPNYAVDGPLEHVSTDIPGNSPLTSDPVDPAKSITGQAKNLVNADLDPSLTPDPSLPHDPSLAPDAPGVPHDHSLTPPPSGLTATDVATKVATKAVTSPDLLQKVFDWASGDKVSSSLITGGLAVAGGIGKAMMDQSTMEKKSSLDLNNATSLQQFKTDQSAANRYQGLIGIGPASVRAPLQRLSGGSVYTTQGLIRRA